MTGLRIAWEEIMFSKIILFRAVENVVMEENARKGSRSFLLLPSYLNFAFSKLIARIRHCQAACLAPIRS
jgi:hypothetical protein